MAKGRIVINSSTCKGCSLCTLACPQHVIQMSADQPNTKGYYPAQYVDPEGTCTGCGLCAVACPDVCITVYRQVTAKAGRAQAVAV